MHNLVFFASGSGTNFQSVIDAIHSGQLQARITGLITDRANIEAIERARKHGISTRILQSPAQINSAELILNHLAEFSPDLIILAGYLKKIPDEVIDKYRGKIINIHPSLLPKYGGRGFFGMNVHKAVIQNREKISGCTVHFVDEIYDNGSIIRQTEIPVAPDETPESLAKKILRHEHEILPQTIQELLTQTT